MKTPIVLVLGKYNNKYLIDIIYNIGFVPLICKNIQGVVSRLRHEHFAVILVDCRYTDIDILELVLNVEDIDKRTPIVILGKLTDESVHKTLAKKRQITIYEDTQKGNKLAVRLEEILMSAEGKQI